MDQKTNLPPSPTHIVELGLLAHDALRSFTQIENVYHEAGPNRSAEIARSCALKSIEVTNRFVRAGLRVEDRHQRPVHGADSNCELLAWAPTPSALSLIFFELLEVQSGRVAPLLRHDAKGLGEGPYNHLRRYTRAGAAAAVQVLHETGLSEKEAAKQVADALNGCGFVNPHGKPYSAKTIMDWRKRRVTLKAGFQDRYREWLLRLRGAVGRAELMRKSGQSWTAEQLRSLIISRLVNLSEVFAYRVEPR